MNENVRMSAPLLSRFDLIFILMDKANEEKDKLLSKHIIQLHTTVNNNYENRDSNGGGGRRMSSQKSRRGLTPDQRRKAMHVYSQANPSGSISNDNLYYVLSVN